jgi:DnaK suppressor protein
MSSKNKKINGFRQKLEAKRDELLGRTGDREAILIENAAEEFDRLQQQLNREVAIRNLDRESTLLKQVQAALARIDDDSYGICLRCEETIPERRLNAVPWAAYCVPCQEVIEANRPAGGGSGGESDDLGDMAA